jgi:predicted DNA-binding WGR domain protein
MSKIHCAIHLQRVEPARRMARYYQLALEPTLFETIAVTRRWGRIGTTGRMKMELVESELQAIEMLLGLLRSKRARGYQVVRGGSGNSTLPLTLTLSP